MTELVVTTPDALQELILCALRSFQKESDSVPQSDWMTTREAAEYLRVQPTRLHQMTSNQEIPFSKMGKSLRFSRQAIDQWMNDST